MTCSYLHVQVVLFLKVPSSIWEDVVNTSHLTNKKTFNPLLFPSLQGRRKCLNSEEDNMCQVFITGWGLWVHACVCAHTVAQLCLPRCDPMGSSPPDSSVHGIFQARILEWVAISSSMASSWSRGRTHVSCLLHGQADSILLRHLGSSTLIFDSVVNVYISIVNNITAKKFLSRAPLIEFKMLVLAGSWLA